MSRSRRRRPAQSRPPQTVATPQVPQHASSITDIAIRSYARSGVGSIARVASELSVALDSLDVTVDDRAAIVVHIGEPEAWKPIAGRRNIGFAWWPFSRIPERALRPLYGIDDMLIVPSGWCARGVTMPKPHQRVAVVPFGVNGTTFAEPDVPRERRDKLRLLVFDAHAASCEAGADIAVAAFKRAFPGRADVALDVWSTDLVDLYTDDPRIGLRRGIGDDRNLLHLYHRYDAMLGTARGSGFGLIPLEAMASGLPVFHTGQGAFEEFADLGVLLGSRQIAVPARAHANAICYEAYVDLAADRLRSFDVKFDEFQARAQRDAQCVRERYTWEASAQRLLDVLEGRDVSTNASHVSERSDLSRTA